MKKTKSLKLVGSYTLDAQGNKVEVDPKEVAAIVNNCAVAAKTIETGIQHRVVGA